MNDIIRVIGIDCSANVMSTGLSLGLYYNHKMILKEARLGNKSASIEEILFNWIGSYEEVILAIDAPLGWPSNLGYALYNHNAGRAINIVANDLFRRETDKFIKKTLGKQPLDVGADRIARTAHCALKIISELSRLIEKPIELAWDNLKFKGIYAIEVYPAATLACYGITNTGYKKKSQQLIRREIIEGLKSHMILSCDTDILENNGDALDSAICLLGAKNFIEGDVYPPPENMSNAKKEGWIWVKKL